MKKIIIISTCMCALLLSSGVALAETSIPGFNDTIEAMLEALRVYYESGATDTVALSMTLDNLMDLFKFIVQ